MKSVWEILGIEETTDRKTIKKAYAALVRDCHQEDEPERWQELHEAYKQAIAAAEGKRIPAYISEKKKAETLADTELKKKETKPRKKATPQEVPKESQKNVQKEVPKEVRKVKLEFSEETEEDKRVEKEVPTEEQRATEEQRQYDEVFEKITSEQRIDERREHILKNLYKLISSAPAGHCATFKHFLDSPKLRNVFEELAFWQAMSEFLRKASTTSETYSYISQKILELLNDEKRNFSEEVLTEMKAAQMLSQAKYREKKKAEEEKKKPTKQELRDILLKLLGGIIVLVFVVLLFGGGSPEDWGRFIVRLLRTLVRIL